MSKGPKRAQPTIQGELESRLSRMLGHPTIVQFAGRTDAGVHACRQLVTFCTESPRTLEDLMRTLNGFVDERIRVVAIREVPLTFRPRHDAVGRTYHYYILPGWPRRQDPFFGQHVWVLDVALDLPAMRRAAAPLVGTHDFSAYTRGGRDKAESARRELRHIHIELPQQGLFARGPFARLRELICIEVEGRSFLRRMVRQIVANLAMVGCGKWPEERPGELLATCNPANGAPPAPACGLYLVDVAYPGETGGEGHV